MQHAGCGRLRPRAKSPEGPRRLSHLAISYGREGPVARSQSRVPLRLCCDSYRRATIPAMASTAASPAASAAASAAATSVVTEGGDGPIRSPATTSRARSARWHGPRGHRPLVNFRGPAHAGSRGHWGARGHRATAGTGRPSERQPSSTVRAPPGTARRRPVSGHGPGWPEQTAPMAITPRPPSAPRADVGDRGN